MEDVSNIYGTHCANPASFMLSSHIILNSTSFEDGVRGNILAGGCNCSRSMFIGACLGAKFSLDSLPKDWIFKTHNHLDILKDIYEVFIIN
jgi:hypothetical protein